MRYIAIFLIIVLFSLFALGADSDNLKYYKIDSNITLSTKCQNVGASSICTGTCNATINYPNGSVMARNQNMPYTMPYYEYNLTDSSIIGKYTATICCAEGNETGCESFSFIINNIGSNNDNPAYIAMILMGLFLIFSIIMTFFFYHNDSWLKYLFLTLDFMLPAILCYFAYLFPSNLNASMAKLFMVGGIIFSVLTIVVIILILLDITIMLIVRLKDAEKRKEAKEWGSELF